MIRKIVKFIIAWFRIPKGTYCYKVVPVISELPSYYLKVMLSYLSKRLWQYPPYAARHKVCLYWKNIEGRAHQEDGWCDYLGKGDIELLKTKRRTITYIAPNTFTDLKVGDEVEGISLLWDQCKECGIKKGKD